MSNLSARNYTVKKTSDYEIIRKMGIKAGLEPGEIGQVVQAWIALKNKKIIGGVMLLKTKDNNIYTIEWLSVREPFRKKGIGTSLVQECINFTKKQEIKKIIISMQIPSFFQKFGFHFVPSKNVPKEFTCFDCTRYKQSCFPVVMVLDLSNSTT